MPRKKKEPIVARCLACNAEFTEKQIAKAVACPACGSKSTPCSPQEDVTIKINVHELRILGIWAENYAALKDNEQLDNPQWESMVKTVNIICDRILDQFPEERKTSLTLTAEVRQVNKVLDCGATLIRFGKEEIV